MNKWRIGTIFVYFFIGIALIFEGFFGIISLVWFIIQVILLAIIAVSIRKIFSKNTQSWKVEILRSTKIVMVVIGIFISTFLTIFGYHTIVPGKISDIVLTNGEKTVHFLSMSHIATESFYDQKRQKLESDILSGSVFLLEGVASWSQESHETFNASLGFNLTSDLYTSFAKITGLVLQEQNRLFLSIEGKDIRNVDLSMDEIAAYLSGTTMPSFSPTETVVDMNETFAIFEAMNPREQLLTRFVLRAFLNWSLKNTDSLEVSLMAGDKKHLFDIILNTRNNRVVDAILNSDKTSFVVVYGALHFPGILEWLKRQDSRWHITTYESFAPYRGE